MSNQAKKKRANKARRDLIKAGVDLTARRPKTFFADILAVTVVAAFAGSLLASEGKYFDAPSHVKYRHPISVRSVFADTARKTVGKYTENAQPLNVAAVGGAEVGALGALGIIGLTQIPVSSRKKRSRQNHLRR